MFDIVDDIAESLLLTSHFLVVDELDDAFEAAENDDGDNDDDEFVDDRDDTVEGVEKEGRDTTTDEPTTFVILSCFFVAKANDLPFFVFVGGLLLLFDMLATDAGFVVLAKEWSSSLAH